MGVITANEAARETRKRIKRAVKRIAKTFIPGSTSAEYMMLEIIKFIDTMDDRQNAKKGGLGVKVVKSKG